MENLPILHGQIVDLADFVNDDKAVLFGWINDPEVVKFNAPFRPVSWEEHCAWFERLNSGDAAVTRSIRARADGRIIGTVQLTGIHAVYRHAEVRIRIGNQGDREKGAGTEALLLLRRLAFGTLNLERLFLFVWADNTRAIRAYRKVGFVEEGILRRHVFICGEWKDAMVMGALRQA